MKIIFLDIDGVCNQWKDGFGWKTHPAPGMKQPYMIDLNIVFSLNSIMSQICLDDVYLVISSSWRNCFKTKKEFCYKTHIGESYIHDDWKTGNSQTGCRWLEIEQWLQDHPEVTKYVIIDDNDDQFPKDNFIQTNQEIGLTYNQLGIALKKLGYNLQGSHMVQKKKSTRKFELLQRNNDHVT